MIFWKVSEVPVGSLKFVATKETTRYRETEDHKFRTASLSVSIQVVLIPTSYLRGSEFEKLPSFSIFPIMFEKCDYFKTDHIHFLSRYSKLSGDPMLCD